MNNLIQEFFDVLDAEYRLGRIDPRSYATLKAHLMVFRQRIESVDLVKAVALYNVIKQVMID